MAYDPPADRPENIPPPTMEDANYGTPTRPVGDTGSVPAAEGSLIDSYKRVVLSPNVSVFEDEIPKASWSKTFIGIGMVMLITLVVGLIIFYGFAALLPDLYDPGRQLRVAEERLRDVGALDRFQWILDGSGFFLSVWGVILGVLVTPIFFFLGAGATYLSARILGGKEGNFMTHAYLLSLSYTPLRVASNLAALVPLVGGIASLAAFFYQLYLAGLSMQASQRMEPGKAMMAAFIPLIIGLVLGCVGIIFIASSLAAALAR